MRSGFCGIDLDAESHARCRMSACVCDCHVKETFTNEAAETVQIGLLEDLSNDEYHALTDWFSSSQLKATLPEYYKIGGSSDALDFGTLVHSIVLEPDNLGHYVALDAEKIGVKADGTLASNPTSTTAWKKAVAEVEQDGKTVVAQADWELAWRMREAIAAHPVAAELLFSGDGVSEESAFAIDENGIRHKCRFDRRIPGLGVDLKTTNAQPGADSLTSTVISYGYDLSALHYLTVAELLDLDMQGFAFVFASKTDQLRVTVAELDDRFLDRGRELRNRALERLTNPAADAYQGATGYLTLEAPEWALRKAFA